MSGLGAVERSESHLASSAARAAPVPSAAKAAEHTPTPEAIENEANKIAGGPGSPVKPNDPALKTESEAAADRTPQENRNELASRSDNTPETNMDKNGKVGEQKPEDTEKLKDQNTKQEQTLSDKMKTPAGIALIAALGLTLALVLKFVIQAALDAKACTDCRDFKITVKSINPVPVSTALSIITFGLKKPNSIEVSWSAPTDYEPLEGKESFTFKDTGLSELDGQTFTIDKVVSKGVVQMNINTDTSDLKGSKGEINPNCADFNSRFNQQVDDAAAAAGNFLGSFFKGLTNNMGTLFLVIGICVLLFFVFKFSDQDHKTVK